MAVWKVFYTTRKPPYLRGLSVSGPNRWLGIQDKRAAVTQPRCAHEDPRSRCEGKGAGNARDPEAIKRCG